MKKEKTRKEEKTGNCLIRQGKTIFHIHFLLSLPENTLTQLHTICNKKKLYDCIETWGQFHQHSTHSFCAISLAPVKNKPTT
jgi:hypothetical protein